MKKYQPGGHKISINCSDEELKETIVSLINDYSESFSFDQFMDDLFSTLDKTNRFQEGSNTISYVGYDLSLSNSNKVQKAVWEMIWDKKLMINLSNVKHNYSPDRVCFRLIKVKE